MAQKTFTEIQRIVAANNMTKESSGIRDRLFICLIWKESTFDPDLVNSTSSATGLMQMTKGAVAEVNRIKKTTYDHNDMKDPDMNVKVGTTYIDILMKRFGGRLKDALNHFGTGKGYADDIIKCSLCLGEKGKKSEDCLHLIHS